MINAKTIKQIKHASIPERIHIVEEILHSLKQDIIRGIAPTKGGQSKPFRVRQFNLGTDIHVDRDILYAERVL